MSFVAEVIAKDIGKREGIDWRRIVQLLASYKNFSPDVRRELSGLKDIEMKILDESFNLLIKLEEIYKRKLSFFDLVGSKEEIEERIKNEIKRKREIFPYLLENVRRFINELDRNLFIFSLMIFLRGSASPRSPKLFIYYEENGEKIFVSDIDIDIIFPFYPGREIEEYIKRKAYRFSLETGIPINPCVKDISSIDRGLFRYGYLVLLKV
jgi:hypothetical protein